MEHYLRKEFYELVRGDESFFDYIQETAPDGVWYWNTKNPGDNWINPRFWKVLGYNTDEIPRVKDTWEKLIHPEDLKTLHTKCTDLSRKNKSGFGQLIRCNHKNGSTT